MAPKDLKAYTLAEVSQHNSAASLWIVLNDKVYDVTKFSLEHPGGEDVLYDLAGQDATESFNDVGHSNDAREMAEEYLIGRVSDEDSKNAKQPVVVENSTVTWKEIICSPTWTNLLIPVGVALLVYFSYKSAQRIFPSI